MISPRYLYDLLPPAIPEIRYNLRDNTRIKIPFARLESYRRSFIPSAIKLWNNLESSARMAPSLSVFKTAIKNPKEASVLYYYGERWTAIQHTRLRIGCSKLNFDLFYNLHVSNDPSCACGYKVENAEHYFLHCPNYKDIRINLEVIISNLTVFNIQHVLFGDKALNITNNNTIFGAVHAFIKASRRFID